MLDLAYSEDSVADIDLNVVDRRHGRFVEVQGTAEGTPVRPAEPRRAPRPRRGRQRATLTELQRAALAG